MRSRSTWSSWIRLTATAFPSSSSARSGTRFSAPQRHQTRISASAIGRTGGGDWRGYADYLSSVIRELTALLAPDGRIVLTFNNHDVRAWTALLGALHAAGLCVIEPSIKCRPSSQPKPNLPQMARMAETSSRSTAWWSRGVSTVSCRRCGGPPSCGKRPPSRSNADQHGVPSASCGMASRHNVAVELLDSRDAVVQEHFAYLDGLLVWRGALDTSCASAQVVALEAALDLDAVGENNTWPSLYWRVAEEMEARSLGVPDPAEVRRWLGGLARFEGSGFELVSNQIRAHQRAREDVALQLTVFSHGDCKRIETAGVSDNLQARDRPAEPGFEPR